MELVLDVVAGACLLGGAAFLVIGAIGLIRLPDFFTGSTPPGSSTRWG